MSEPIPYDTTKRIGYEFKAHCIVDAILEPGHTLLWNTEFQGMQQDGVWEEIGSFLFEIGQYYCGVTGFTELAGSSKYQLIADSAYPEGIDSSNTISIYVLTGADAQYFDNSADLTPFTPVFIFSSMSDFFEVDWLNFNSSGSVIAAQSSPKNARISMIRTSYKTTISPLLTCKSFMSELEILIPENATLNPGTLILTPVIYSIDRTIAITGSPISITFGQGPSGGC
jgi:hypothetical protein